MIRDAVVKTGLVNTAFSAALMVMAATAGVGAGQQARPSSEYYELLSTGDRVDYFGTIGTSYPEVWGLDDSGRALVTLDLSDGRQGLFFASPDEVEVVWLPEQFEGWIRPATTSPAGRVAFVQEAAGRDRSLELVQEQQAVTIAAEMITSVQGNILCDIGSFAVNDAGVVAFTATYASAPSECNTPAFEDNTAMYLYESGTLHEVLKAPFGDPDGDQVTSVLGISPIGAVYLAARLDGLFAIWEVMGGKGRPIVAEGEIARARLGSAVVSPNGVVAFEARVCDEQRNCRNEMYVVREGVIRKVVDKNARPPFSPGNLDLRPGCDSGCSVNDDGDLMLGWWMVEWEFFTRLSGFVIYHFDGSEPEVVYGDGQAVSTRAVTTELAPYMVEDGGALNAKGHAVVGMYSHGGDSSRWVGFWDGDALVKVVGSGDHWQANTTFAEGGFDTGTGCVAEDGSFASLIYGTSGRSGLVCIDETGAKLVAQTSGGGGSGRVFTCSVESCEFVGDRLYFAMGRGAGPTTRYSCSDADAETGVFRADSGGLVELLGVGDEVSGIGHIAALRDFAVNEAGTLVASVAARHGDDSETDLVLQIDQTGEVTRLFDGRAQDIGITSSGRVFILTETSVMEWRGGVLTNRISNDAPAQDGRVYDLFEVLVVSGEQAAYLVSTADYEYRTVFVETENGPTPLIAGSLWENGSGSIGGYSPVGLHDIAADGSAIVGVARRSPADGSVDYSTMVLDLSSIKFIAAGANLEHLWYLNARGDLVGWGRIPWPSTRIAAISAVGELGGSSCPNVICHGDCDGDGAVGINELVIGVREALTNGVAERCRSMDRDGNAAIDVSELTQAVASSLEACGDASIDSRLAAPRVAK